PPRAAVESHSTARNGARGIGWEVAVSAVPASSTAGHILELSLLLTILPEPAPVGLSSALLTMSRTAITRRIFRTDHSGGDGHGRFLPAAVVLGRLAPAGGAGRGRAARPRRVLGPRASGAGRTGIAAVRVAGPEIQSAGAAGTASLPPGN